MTFFSSGATLTFVLVFSLCVVPVFSALAELAITAAEFDFSTQIRVYKDVNEKAGTV